MKKRIIIALFASCLLICSLLLVACGNNNDTSTNTNTNEEETSEITYTVKVVDYKGAPISSGLFVQLYKDGEALGSMKKANKDGEASFTLEKGEYTYEIILADDTLTYDKENVKLTAKAPSKEVMLYKELGEEKITIAPYDEKIGDRVEKDAYFIEEGATLVPIDGMTYYIFQPTRGGIYRFSYISDVAITIGYYGRSDFVLDYSIAEVENRAFEVEITDGGVSSGIGGTTRMVIGVKSLAVDSCVLTIERISDPKQELPRIDYAPLEVPKDKQIYDFLNSKLVDLDVTDKDLKVVYSANDGFYHYGTEDGPVVLVRIKTPSKYIASFYTICETTNLYKIIKDEGGTPIRMEIYNQMIGAYAEVCDDSGVVPLTKELEYAIKNIGEQLGWWGDNPIFKVGDDILEDGTMVDGEVLDVPVENAWLFACCYLETTSAGTEEQKITIKDTVEEKQYNLILEKDATLYLKSTNKASATITIENAQNITLIYAGNEYVADQKGTIELLLTAEDGFDFAIKNTGESTELSFTFVTYIP